MSFDIKQHLNVYEFTTRLPGTGQEIKFRPISTGQFKQLLAYEGNEEQDITFVDHLLDNLISSCVISEGFDIKDLYIQDRLFLLMEIRKKTSGSQYQFTRKCEKCKSQSIQNIDLNNLKCKKLEKIENDLIQITDDLYFRLALPTRGMQIEAGEYIKKTNPTATETMKLADIIITTYALSIKEVIFKNEKVEVPFEDIVETLNNLPRNVYDRISNWFEENNFGLNTTVTFKCNACKNEVEEKLPMVDFFF